MGLVTKIFGGLFSFIGGLFSSIAKVFGIGKNEFYIELDDSAQPVAQEAGAPAPSSPAPSAKAEPAPAKASSKPAEKAPAASVPQQAAAASTPSPAGGPARPLVLPKPQPEVQVQAPKGSATFATDFLVNPRLNRSPRRRPGPSVSPFKEMAKSINKQATSMG